MSQSDIYTYVPDEYTEERLKAGGKTVRVFDQYPHRNAADRFNTRFAVWVTKGVGSMWCAYAFAALALVGLPSAVESGSAVVVVSWISQTFLQLVLLSVIIVGQNVLAAAADKRAIATYEDTNSVLHETRKLQFHLAAQDEVLERLVAGASGQGG